VSFDERGKRLSALDLKRVANIKRGRLPGKKGGARGEVLSLKIKYGRSWGGGIAECDTHVGRTVAEIPSNVSLLAIVE